MNLDRLLFRLVQPLIALLLIAAPAQAEPCSFEDEGRVQAFATVLNVIDTISDKGDHALPAVQPVPAQDDGDHGSSALMAPLPSELPVSPARLIETGIAARSTAPPSHRPCAAPPTGPPLV